MDTKTQQGHKNTAGTQRYKDTKTQGDKDTGRTQRHIYLQLHPLIFQMGSSDDRLVIINNIIQLPQCVHLIRNFHIV